VLSENLYRFHLDIAMMDLNEVSNVHTVTITTKGIKKMINFNLALKMKQAREFILEKLIFASFLYLKQMLELSMLHDLK
jgi:hypothetical protein